MTSSFSALIIVPSAAHHEDHRGAIRRTWGNTTFLADLGIRIAFLFGDPVDSKQQQIIQSEALLYNDVIQSNAFVDSYMNLTLKSMSMLRWTDQFCAGVGFLFKVDDDMFIRIDNLISYIEQKGDSLRRSVFGRLIPHVRPIRNKKSKYYISEEEYGQEFYPTYVAGTAYVISGDLISELLAAASTLSGPFLPFEDTFTTGILVEKVGAKRLDHRGFNKVKGSRNPCDYTNVVSGHQIKPPDIIFLWKTLKIYNETLCT